VFHLTRVYSIVSLAGIVITAVVLGLFHRHIAVSSLITHETQSNVALTQAFSNTLWPKYAAFIGRAGRLPAPVLARQPEVRTLDAEIRNKARGLGIVKIKIYDLNGLTVYSTEPRQIGEDKSGNLGFRQARAGEVASEMVYRDHVSAFEQIIEDRHLMSSYVPIRRAESGPVEGVFEVYSDITHLVSEIERTEWLVLGVVAVLMLLLYAFLLVVVRRADQLIRRHRDEEQQMQQQRIQFLAGHDPLTGLANRALLRQELERAVQQAPPALTPLGLLLINLDRFKIVNDSLGHQYGDRALIEAAGRIRSALRDGDTAYRAGGDEFAVLLPALAGPETATAVAEDIQQRFSEPLQLDGHEVFLTPSIGIAVFPTLSRDAAQLQKHAEAALRHAKGTGRNRLVVYSKELDMYVRESLDFETDLRRALANREFRLYYQPLVHASGGHVFGAEALLRWHHPVHGVILPDRFIPLLEETGLIVPVGEWVIREAARRCLFWQRPGRERMRMSVNVSPRQFFSGALVPAVRRALEENGLPAACLMLEITESALLGNNDLTARQLHELRELGVRLAIDDFGIGYSSLSYLRSLPIDTLKVDRSFVRDLPVNAETASIVTAILALAKSLRLGVIAEGVETAEQARFLRTLGCELMQGYLFGKPLPLNEFEKRLWQVASGHAAAAS
jgi:diguanylate cyclase (GGDEF)-like protein